MQRGGLTVTKYPSIPKKPPAVTKPPPPPPTAKQPTTTPVPRMIQDHAFHSVAPSYGVTPQTRPAMISMPTYTPAAGHMVEDHAFHSVAPSYSFLKQENVPEPSAKELEDAPTTTEDNVNLADFAKAAYTPGTQMEGYDIDRELSGPDRQVYVNKKTKKAIVAFRGTDTEHNAKRDILTDLGLAMGLDKHLNRFKHSVDVTQRAIEKYGKDNILVTGHSLGGSQARYVGEKLGVKGAAYNPYVHYLGAKFAKKNPVETWAVAGDPVAAAAMASKYTHIVHAKSKYWGFAGKLAAGAAATAATENPSFFLEALGQLPSTALSLHALDNFTSPKH